MEKYLRREAQAPLSEYLHRSILGQETANIILMSTVGYPVKPQNPLHQSIAITGLLGGISVALHVQEFVTVHNLKSNKNVT